MGCGTSMATEALTRIDGGDVAEGTTAFSRVAVPRHELGRPASLTTEMGTGSLATVRLSMRNGYGASRHVC